MNRVKILGKAVGIQWRGVTDQSKQAVTGLGEAVIVGRFRRGRTDKPIIIHLGNIRAELGYDPNNPDYQVVQDILARNVPQIKVLRVGA